MSMIPRAFIWNGGRDRRAHYPRLQIARLGISRSSLGSRQGEPRSENRRPRDLHRTSACCRLLSQRRCRRDGCPRHRSIEYRVNAEAPEQGFRPSHGRINLWQELNGSGVRVDARCYAGYLLPPYYDSMIAKVTTHAGTRLDALSKMDRALSTFAVDGVDMTIAFLRSLISHPNVQNGKTQVRWIENLRGK